MVKVCGMVRVWDMGKVWGMLRVWEMVRVWDIVRIWGMVMVWGMGRVWEVLGGEGRHPIPPKKAQVGTTSLSNPESQQSFQTITFHHQNDALYVSNFEPKQVRSPPELPNDHFSLSKQCPVNPFRSVRNPEGHQSFKTFTFHYQINTL